MHEPLERRNQCVFRVPRRLRENHPLLPNGSLCFGRLMHSRAHSDMGCVPCYPHSSLLCVRYSALPVSPSYSFLPRSFTHKDPEQRRRHGIHVSKLKSTTPTVDSHPPPPRKIVRLGGNSPDTFLLWDAFGCSMPQAYSSGSTAVVLRDLYSVIPNYEASMREDNDKRHERPIFTGHFQHAHVAAPSCAPPLRASFIV